MKKFFYLIHMQLFIVIGAYGQPIDMNFPPMGTTRFVGGSADGMTGYIVKIIGNFTRTGESELAIGEPFNDKVNIILGNRNQPDSIDLSNLRNKGFAIKGNDGSGFGFSISALGDFDNDGYKDIAIGAPFDGVGGRVYVLKGSQYPPASASVEDEDLFALIVEGSPGELLGFSLADGDTFNNDALNDLLIYRAGVSAERDGQEAVYAIYGQRSFPEKIIQTNNLDQTSTLTILGPKTDSGIGYFGNAFEFIGDYTQDGSSDLALFTGVTQEENPKGTIMILPGGTALTGTYNYNEIPLAVREISFQLFPDPNMHAVSVIKGGDATGDGRADLIAGLASGNIGGGTAPTGLIAIIPGSANATPSINITKEAPGDAILLGHWIANSGLGESISTSGTLIAAGAFRAVSPADATSHTGTVYIVNGANLKRGMMEQIAKTSSIAFYGKKDGDQFGLSVHFLGDLNQDGHQDLFVGVPGNKDDAEAFAFLVPFVPAFIDFNADGRLTPLDLFFFQHGWGMASSAADWNADGIADGSDLLGILLRLKTQ
ncbi:MAG: integrin alpha [Candidatus Omnitrophota bacterium]